MRTDGYKKMKKAKPVLWFANRSESPTVICRTFLPVHSVCMQELPTGLSLYDLASCRLANQSQTYHIHPHVMNAPTNHWELKKNWVQLAKKRTTTSAYVFLTHITSNVAIHAWSTKYRLIIYMSAQIKSNLRDESIKPN
jgi:hypothetical protein